MQRWLTRIVRIHPGFQFSRRQHPFRLHHRSLAMDPLGLEGIEPRALTRQHAGDEADALPLRRDPRVVGAYPVAYRGTFMPRGIVPNQQQRLFAQCREFVTAPGQKLRREAN